jgi:hypothetical protein
VLNRDEAGREWPQECLRLLGFVPRIILPLLSSFLNILGIRTRSLFPENITLSLRRRINVCFVSKVDILPEIVDYLVLVLPAIILSFLVIQARNLFLHICLFKAPSSFYIDLKPAGESPTRNP